MSDLEIPFEGLTEAAGSPNTTAVESGSSQDSQGQGANVPLPSVEELQSALLASLADNARLATDKAGLLAQLEQTEVVVLDLRDRIDAMADDVEDLNMVRDDLQSQVHGLNRRYERMLERHQQQFLSMTRAHTQHLANMETEHLQEKNKLLNELLVAHRNLSWFQEQRAGAMPYLSVDQNSAVAAGAATDCASIVEEPSGNAEITAGQVISGSNEIASRDAEGADGRDRAGGADLVDGIAGVGINDEQREA